MKKLEITYNSVLKFLSPIMIVEQFSIPKNDTEFDEYTARLNQFISINNKQPKYIINGVLIYVLRINKGKLPNLNYLNKTLQTFIDLKLDSTDKIVTHLINRANFVTTKIEKRNEERKAYYQRKYVEQANLEDDIERARQLLRKEWS